MRKLYLGNFGWVYRVAKNQHEPDRAPEYKTLIINSNHDPMEVK